MYTDKKSKVAAIISYLFSWVGIIIAFIIRDKDDALSRHHLNQALVLAIAEAVTAVLIRIGGIFAWAGGIIDFAIFVLAIMGIVRAAKGSAEPLPFIGDIKIY